MHESFLDVFYNVLLNEFAFGRVDCYFKFNMRFDTRIINEDIHIIGNNDGEDNMLVPTLIISNKDEFDRLLVRYVNLALDFYDEFIYYDEIRNSNYFDNKLGVSCEKLIMTLLWSNACFEDFNDPCEFLRKRIAYFELGELEKYCKEVIVGNSSILGYDISIKIVKNALESETPYSFKCYLIDDNRDKVYEFPNIYFGIYNNNCYLYAIQNDKNSILNFRNNAIKKKKQIDRLLYKVNGGLDVNLDNYDNYGIGNLKDITPNALVVSNIFIGLIKNNNIFKYVVSSILITRWNAKMTILNNRVEKLILDNINKDEIEKIILENEENCYYLQSNMTEKFLRVFRRLVYHHDSFEIINYPFDVGSNLEFEIVKFGDNCNNELLDETYNISNDNFKLVRRKGNS